MKDSSTLDKLNITGIRAYGYTGFLPEEQTLGQWFEVDLTIWMNITKAGISDRLEDTYDYRASIAAIQALIRTERFKLIEALTEAIAKIVLSTGTVAQVRVQLTKVSPPIPDFSGKVSIEVIRASSSFI
jgi:7,8-dihydroneopterin aldolase/epimerase/oxygenase